MDGVLLSKHTWLNQVIAITVCKHFLVLLYNKCWKGGCNIDLKWEIITLKRLRKTGLEHKEVIKAFEKYTTWAWVNSQQGN